VDSVGVQGAQADKNSHVIASFGITLYIIYRIKERGKITSVLDHCCFFILFGSDILFLFYEISHLCIPFHFTVR
jgi:hypothetical protein